MPKTIRQMHREYHTEVLSMARRAKTLDRAMAFQLLAQAATLRFYFANTPR